MNRLPRRIAEGGHKGMTMAVLGVGAALLALALLFDKRGGTLNKVAIGGLVVSWCLAFLLTPRLAGTQSIAAVLHGFLLGAAGTALASVLGAKARSSALAAGIALLTVYCAYAWVVERGAEPGLIAVLAGAGWAAALLADAAAVLACLAIGGLALIGVTTSWAALPAQMTPHAPLMLGLGGFLSLAASLIPESALNRVWAGPARDVLGFLIMIACAYWVGMKSAGDPDLWHCLAAGIVVAFVSALALPKHEPYGGFRSLVVSVMWVAVGTLSFGWAHSIGMGYALAGALASFVFLGRLDALAMSWPLFGLVGYRVYAWLAGSPNEYISVGQYYVVTALLMGVALPVLDGEWVARTKAGLTRSVGSVIWAWLMVLTLLGCAALLGKEAFAGLVVGASISMFATGAMLNAATVVAAASAGLIGTLLTLYPWLNQQFGYTREQKTSLMIWYVIPTAVLGILWWWLSMRSREVEAA